MPLTIFIKDLVVSGKHGVHPHEKNTAQRFGVSVEAELVGPQAAHSDKLEDTADWSRIRDEIAAIVEQESFDLVERLAGAIAARLLEDTRIAAVTVTIDKLDAFNSGVPGVRFTSSRS